MGKEDVFTHTHTHTQTHTHTHNGILCSHEKKILLFGTTWMDFEGFVLSEISKTGKDKRWMISLTRGI